MNRKLFDYIRHQFRLDLYGVHGIPHWSRVQYFGLKIGKKEKARLDVVKLFSILHDSQRAPLHHPLRGSDKNDSAHGERAVAFARDLRGEFFDLDDDGFELLCEALALHSNGLTAANVTVQTCWDADRLDLGRIGIYPDARFLCTQTAKDPAFIHRAWTMTNRPS